MIKKIRGSTNIIRHFKNNHLFDKRLSFLSKEFVVISDNNNSDNFNNLDMHLDSSESSSISLENSPNPPCLLNPYIEGDLSLEDRFCKLVVSQKKKYKTTETAVLNIAQDWFNFYSNYLEIGDFLINLK